MIPFESEGPTEALLAWYDEHQRDLPWRAGRDPYRIWISEAMLQQTRVETVLDYYRCFLERFPDVESLARADIGEVLSLWSGLGYYRRARTLHQAAQLLVRQHGGRFPRTRAELLDLPGIGPYTAGAILSIAFDLPEALVDGNVTRVFCRLFGLELELGSGALKRLTWELAQRHVPRIRAGDWNQALMELGATLCAPRKPRCGECPLAGSCVAQRTSRTGELPRARPKPETIAVELEIALVGRAGRWLLEQRPAQGRMAEMWQFPTRERTRPGVGPYLFEARWPLELSSFEALAELRHAITRHRIRAQVFQAELASRTEISAPLAWFEEREIDALGLTGMAKKARRLAPGVPEPPRMSSEA